eukprot:scaffold36581_cov72-Phaeocystis_antarctica.AAC.5
MSVPHFSGIGSAAGSDSGRICEAIAPAAACRAGWGARLSEEDRPTCRNQAQLYAPCWRKA